MAFESYHKLIQQTGI